MAIPIVGKIIDSVIDKGASLISEFITDKDKAAELEHQWRQHVSRENHEIKKIEIEAEKELEEEFSRRTIVMEGTASDLKAIPYVGALVVFARGMFRPMFSYATLYWDWVFFTTDTSGWSEQQKTLLLTINLIVLVFFFGERAVKNLAPILQKVFAK